MKADGYPTAIRVASPAWFDWLVSHRSFRYECSEGSFTANKETRKAGMFWYANRRVNGQLRRAYLGASSDLTLEKLVEVAVKLSGDRSSYTTSEQCVTESSVCVTELSNCVTDSYTTIFDAEKQELLSQLSELRDKVTHLESGIRMQTERANEYLRGMSEAAAILHEALTLKANAGGAIKAEIKRALPLIDNV